MGLLKSVRWRPLKLVLRGVNGHVWMLCYEDLKEVVDALRVFMGLWGQEGRRQEGALVRVFWEGGQEAVSIWGFGRG